MAFKRYDPRIKDSIIKVAREARAADKSWKEAHAAAKTAGYRGSVEGLDAMIRVASKKAGKAKAKTPPAQAMAKLAQTAPVAANAAAPKRYDPRKKAAFIKAAVDARAAGKTRGAIHAAATAAGYTGKVKSLENLIGRAKAKAAKPTNKATPAAAKPVTKQPHRPGSAAPTDYDPVKEMIDQVVKKRLEAAVEKAIAELRKAVE